ncbi:MAG: zinc ribbon domain-containing protein [Tyzzerella sp.]|nr:zinc ribbon domain-containing protein [Tyzzerella sp.]
MNCTYNSEAEVKHLYMQTDLTDIASVQSTISCISKNTQLSNKAKYMEALNSANPANLAKARKYHELSKSVIMKNLGWIVMAVFAVVMGVIDSDFDDAITSWISLGFCVGAAIQIYIAALKSSWSKLTLSGLVIHPAVMSPNLSAAKNVVAPTVKATSEWCFCSQCGAKNGAGTKFCSECGSELS